MNYLAEYERWLHSPVLSEEEKESIRRIDSEEEKKLAFGQTLEFGTAGLRSSMAMGPGRMNIYTVAQATQGMANLIKKEGGEARGAVVGYDSRHHSPLFARVAAEVLVGNGIKTYLFDGLRPTPELSFAIRELSCIAGINITASHNPKQYNGYKAYWEDGAQLSPEQAAVVSQAIDEVEVLGGALRAPFEEALESGHITLLDESFDERYLAAVEKTVIDRDVIERVADELKIVYTPLHGAGRRLVPKILERVGFRHIYPVKEQMIPDGDFPTVIKPNPEYPEVFTLGIRLANEVGSDLIIASDPDADRTGVMARRKDGSFYAISGNQMGALLLHYIIGARRRLGKLPENAFTIKSIVSTDIITKICAVNGVRLFDVLTGFKYIGEVIKEHEEKGREGDFIFAFEESYGYLTGTYARDKDAVGTTLMIAEMTAYYKSRGMTLCDALRELYEVYGTYSEKTTEIYMEGLDGIERRRRVMARLRMDPPKSLGGVRITDIGDYLSGFFTNLASGERTPTGQSASDVLSYKTEAGDKVVIRPSGTEPKIKIYYLVSGKDQSEAEEKIKAYESDAQGFSKV